MKTLVKTGQAKTLVLMKFGSHLYGTNTPASDTDYKGVFIPDMRDVLLGRQPKTSITESTGQALSKNTVDDVDTEMFTLQGFLRMVAEGQVVALDMLFAPKEMFVEYDPYWDSVQAFAKEYLLCKQTTAYVGYCRKQAAKYGIRGSRVGEVRQLLDFLNKIEDKASKMYEHYEALKNHCVDKEFTSIIEAKETRNIGGGGVKNQWANLMVDCCNRKCTLTVNVKGAIEMFQKLFDAYGARALQAESNEGVDWKAMSHAMRCCEEAIELLDTHKITFPLVRAEYHKEVKQGKHDYKKIAEELEELMAEVERAAARSTLPDDPRWKALDNYVVGVYERMLREAFKLEDKAEEKGLF